MIMTGAAASQTTADFRTQAQATTQSPCTAAVHQPSTARVTAGDYKAKHCTQRDFRQEDSSEFDDQQVSGQQASRCVWW